MMVDAIATPPGHASPRISKRIADARIYTIDCSPLLRKHELLVEVLGVQAPGLQTDGARTRAGTSLELHIAGGGVPASMPHKDFTVSASIRTSQGSIGVAFDVRVHA